jgi:hypothetical protein
VRQAQSIWHRGGVNRVVNVLLAILVFAALGYLAYLYVTGHNDVGQCVPASPPVGCPVG